MTQLKTVLIAIGGPSSSGKTTIAKILHSLTKNSILLHQDDFYKNDEDIPIDEASGFENWDCPEALNFETFKKELDHLKQYGDLSPETKSYENRYNSDTKDQNFNGLSPEIIEQSKIKINNILSQTNTKIAYIDGFLLHHDPELVKLFDINVLLLASYDTLKARRFARNGYQTQESFWVDPPEFFDKIVYPSFCKSYAHLFIDNDISKGLDSKKVKEQEINVFYNEQGTPLTEVFERCVNLIVNSLS